MTTWKQAARSELEVDLSKDYVAVLQDMLKVFECVPRHWLARQGTKQASISFGSFYGCILYCAVRKCYDLCAESQMDEFSQQYYSDSS